MTPNGRVVAAAVAAAAIGGAGVVLSRGDDPSLAPRVEHAMDAVRPAPGGDVVLDAGCEIGVGECTRRGVYVNVDGTLICSVLEPGAPHAEVCGNTRDDNCDGDTDESCFGFERDGGSVP